MLKSPEPQEKLPFNNVFICVSNVVKRCIVDKSPPDVPLPKLIEFISQSQDQKADIPNDLILRDIRYIGVLALIVVTSNVSVLHMTSCNTSNPSFGVNKTE